MYCFATLYYSKNIIIFLATRENLKGEIETPAKVFRILFCSQFWLFENFLDPLRSLSLVRAIPIEKNLSRGHRIKHIQTPFNKNSRQNAIQKCCGQWLWRKRLLRWWVSGAWCSHKTVCIGTNVWTTKIIMSMFDALHHPLLVSQSAASGHWTPDFSANEGNACLARCH
jgi:hypothetical protein